MLWEGGAAALGRAFRGLQSRLVLGKGQEGAACARAQRKRSEIQRSKAR